jgi:hypothetical protein
MEVAQKALEVALMLWCSFMVRLLELGISNVSLAVLAPVFGLCIVSKDRMGQLRALTVDFQYSDIVADCAKRNL